MQAMRSRAYLLTPPPPLARPTCPSSFSILGALRSPHDHKTELLCKKSHFGTRSGGCPFWELWAVGAFKKASMRQLLCWSSPVVVLVSVGRSLDASCTWRLPLVVRERFVCEVHVLHDMRAFVWVIVCGCVCVCVCECACQSVNPILAAVFSQTMAMPKVGKLDYPGLLIGPTRRIVQAPQPVPRIRRLHDGGVPYARRLLEHGV